MYDSIPSGGSIPKWLGCLLGAGLGITPALASDSEPLYEWDVEGYGDFGSIAFNYLNKYFKSIYQTN